MDSDIRNIPDDGGGWSRKYELKTVYQGLYHSSSYSWCRVCVQKVKRLMNVYPYHE